MSYRGQSQGGKRNYPYNRNNNYSSRGGPKRQGNNDDFGLPPVDWKRLNLEPVKKQFYKEHPNVTNMSSSDVARIRQEKEITVPKNCAKPVTAFDQCGLPNYILRGFESKGFTEPTAIQCQSWPVILSGNDMIGVAETGSGKTLAFLIPAIVHINAQKPIETGDGPIVLVVAPTRELALQTESQIKEFGQSSMLRYTSVYGGVPKYRQMEHLKRGVDIVVATPGRLLDFLSTGATNLQRVTYLVLDEADRMLDMGFEKPIRQIIGQIRPDRQTLLFSATWPKSIQNLANEFLVRPVQVNIGSLGISSCKNVDQKFEVVDERNKVMKILFYLKQLDRTEKVLIFVATKVMTATLCNELRSNGFYCGSISGDKKQFERENILQQFRNGRINILIGTDVASRGIDIKDIRVVINYDFPNTIEDYVHRIGRTGRANSLGSSYTLMTRKNGNKVRDLIELLQNDKKEIPRDVLKLQSNYGGGYRPQRRNYRS